MEAIVNKQDRIFFNYSFDKKRLKALISWVFKQSGEAEALKVIDLLKETGFRHATKAGISIGLHDLTTPIQKSWLISESQLAMNTTERDFIGARITATERSQRIIDTWHRSSESLSKQVVDYFGIYDRFNPVYIMALSGARGNFSQVRQLIGMRGLMADQQGKIVNFPIRSNLREGLTLTEYFISCSGARKGLVDTALRTADTGYLTRRLVDVSHHVVVKRIRCNTNRGIAFKSLQSYNKIVLPLKERLVGRVLAENILLENEDTVLDEFCKTKSRKQSFIPLLTKRSFVSHTNLRFVKPKQHESFQKNIAKKDQEISLKLALKIAKVKDKVYLRSPLTCGFTHSVCQLCYGWSISQGSLVSLGDAVGVIAAQSIGEPGTQLTMRTFHTGGVFSGDLLQEIKAPHAGKIEFSKAFQGLLIRTAHGRIAFLSKSEGSLFLKCDEVRKQSALSPKQNKNEKKSNSVTIISIPAFTMLFVRQGEKVENNQLLAEFSITTKEGNQPIKTEQTIFAQLSGKVIEDCTGKIYTKSIKESNFLLDTLQSTETLVYKPYKSEISTEMKSFNFTSKQSKQIIPFRKSFWTYKAEFESASKDLQKALFSLKTDLHNQGLTKRSFVSLRRCYGNKLDTHNKVPISPYVTQDIFSFSTYNVDICTKKANHQSNFESQIFTNSLKKGQFFVTKSPTFINNEVFGSKKDEFRKRLLYYGIKKEKLVQSRLQINSHKDFNLLKPFKHRVSWGKKYKSKICKKLCKLCTYKYKYFGLTSTNQRFVKRFVWPSDHSTNFITSAKLMTFSQSTHTSTSAKLRIHASTNQRFVKRFACNAKKFASSSICKGKNLYRFPYIKIVKQNGLPNYVEKEKLKVQPFSLCSTENSLAQIRKLNVPHSLQNTVLQKILETKLGAWGVSGKRFTFLNETKKKQFPMCKGQILFSHKSEDLESDRFKYIEPTQSGRLGFLKVLSARVGATLDYNSPVKLTYQFFKKRKSQLTFKSILPKCALVLQNQNMQKSVKVEKEKVFSSTFTDKYFHPESIKENRFCLQTIAEYGDLVEEGYSFHIN